jgi:OmpA-OmpF porin, OOP family
MVNYGMKPLVVGWEGEEVGVVRSMVTGDLLGSFTLIPALQFGLKIPISYVSGDGIDRNVGGAMAGGAKKVGLGDPEIEAKYRFVGDLESPFAAAAAVFGTAPVGAAMAKGKYIGDESPTGGVRGIADVKLGQVSVAANVVGAFRKKATIGATKIGSELRYSVAAGYHFGQTFRLLVEGLGNTRFSSEADGSNGLEALLGGQLTPTGSAFTFTLGGGAQITEGVGIPKFRGLGGVMYNSEPRDRDRDGIMDDKDACPTEPEDVDEHEDSDGCPDVDNDGDDFKDSADACPNEAEDRDRFQDTDGCPDLDNDKDGIPDERDLCRDKPETKNGYKDEDGCPDEADTDNDGIVDARDQCVDMPEDTDGFQDEDGCPDADNDNDGIPDNADECVDEPETMNGFEDTDGCPDTPPKGFKIPKEFRTPKNP